MGNLAFLVYKDLCEGFFFSCTYIFKNLSLNVALFWKSAITIKSISQNNVFIQVVVMHLKFSIFAENCNTETKKFQKEKSDPANI